VKEGCWEGLNKSLVVVK